jgi:uncharacterized protein
VQGRARGWLLYHRGSAPRLTPRTNPLSRDAWDASDFLGALRQSTAALRAEVDQVNALNVFPVPDGDTGSNMLATLQAALEEAQAVPGPDRNVAVVAEAFSRGALMGARGNSGVILSQFVRGVSDALRDVADVDAAALAEALTRGHLASVAAVAHPVEGTMLTVAREAAAAAQAAAVNGASLESVLDRAVGAASDAVARTPEQLAVLAAARVVDAGGRGVELILRGALGFVRGEALPVAPHDVLAFPSFAVDEDVGYGYETVFLVVPGDDQVLDPDAIRTALDAMGESVLVAGDERAVKVHIHNERPDEVIAYGLSLGTMTSITIENLDRQTHEMRWRGRQAPSREPIVRQAASASGPAVVAVAAGAGLAGMFAELGAAGVVTGGQGANPSTGDLVEAFRATGSSQVIVLPNNPNVRMAAVQAGALLPDIEVSVIPTRNPAEGIAALLTVNPSDDLAANVARMTEASRALQTMLETTAIRDATIAGRVVRKGEHIVLGPDDALLASGAERAATILEALANLEPGFELVTLYYGEGVTRAAAEGLAEKIGERFAGIETEIVDGGQPHYGFIISAE